MLNDPNALSMKVISSPVITPGQSEVLFAAQLDSGEIIPMAIQSSNTSSQKYIKEVVVKYKRIIGIVHYERMGTTHLRHVTPCRT